MKIVENKKEKYGFCNTILIEDVFDEKVSILLQSAFSTSEKYIDHVHTVDVKPAMVSKKLSEIILYNFKNLMKLKQRSINLFFY